MYIKRGWHQSGRKAESGVAATRQKTEEQTHKRRQSTGLFKSRHTPGGPGSTPASRHWGFLLCYRVQTHFGRRVSSGPES